jgi:putative ABC transport system ATP-binding protein
VSVPVMTVPGEPPASVALAAVRASGLRKTYGRGETAVHALAGVDVTFARGEFTAIMGPSGSGKSTLMHCLAGLDTATAGQVWLGETELTSLRDDELTTLRRRRIGFVFQSFNLIPRTDAMHNVELPLVYNGVRRRRGKAQAALERVGLGTRLHHVPSELSGGQKQRVAIARALINDPSIILADEPTGALDSSSTTEIMELFTELNQQGCTIVVITHEDEVAEYCTRRVWLRDGNIVSDDVVDKRHGRLSAVNA